MTIRRTSISSVVLITTCLLATIAIGAEPVRKPNVVLILADDLGWSDTTLFGTTRFYKTPNIERLATRGMTFTRAYAASPLCSPTRASVLTGLNPARHGITAPTCHLPTVTLKATPRITGPPDAKATVLTSVSRLDTRYYTLAEMLQDNGYATGHFGKWHLGAEPYSPLQHGFDVDVPHHPGPGPAGSYVAPWKFRDFDHDPDIPDEHIEDRMAKEAVAFMEKHRDQPFFLNYWMFSVHAPFDAKRTLIDQYRKQVDKTNPQRSPTYAAMIESMDDAVGTLLDTLDRLAISDNTIIVFASDNGGNMYNEIDGTSPTSNAPLRGGKATMWEGGVRGPAIVVYPDHVQAGTRSTEIIQSCDFYPTLLQLLDIESQQSFDGISIVPALRGGALQREAIFTYFPHQTAVPDWLPPSVSVHAGDWKLIRIFHGNSPHQHSYQLFNLKSDLGEQTNLAADNPLRVQELDKRITEFLTDTHAVVPLPNPRFDPAQYDPKMIGKAKLKSTRKPKGTGPNKPRRRANPVAGWQPGGTCKLALQGRSMLVTSSGGDPYLSYQLPAELTQKKLVLQVTLASDSRGSGQVFWQEKGVAPAFFRDRSVGFEVQHDGKPHDYSISWSAKNPVVAVRIDPATAPGKITISRMRLCDGDGNEVYRWKF
ncbi:MAG: N-acetylgalactosamine 6-sulfate sulfatase (GALNS) [Blastopirellula sp.]|nr:N-acetylgalactosamine 6-sulfate sulfatase (GALNS) [Blastopirellula sp.]